MRMSAIMKVAPFARFTMVLNSKLKIMMGNNNNMTDLIVKLIAYKICLNSSDKYGVTTTNMMMKKISKIGSLRNTEFPH